MQPHEARIARQIAASVRRHRALRGWSQATLAEKLDVSVDYVGLLERAERLPALGTLVKLKEVFGVRADELLDASGKTAAWDSDALALLRAVPQHLQPIIVAMLRVAASYRHGPAADERTRRRSLPKKDPT